MYQAMMLFNIGDAEMTVGELTTRGCYLGSNVSYNVKKLVENGYLAQERSEHDRRSFHVKLTKKGRALRDRLSAMHSRHIEMLTQAQVTPRGSRSGRHDPAPPGALLDAYRRSYCRGTAVCRLSRAVQQNVIKRRDRRQVQSREAASQSTKPHQPGKRTQHQHR
jgi:MarR family